MFARYIAPEEDDRHYFALQVVRTSDRRRSHFVPFIERAVYPGRKTVWQYATTICGIPYRKTHWATMGKHTCQRCERGVRSASKTTRHLFPDLVG